MPYASDADVPSYVPKKKRAQWRAVWNSIYEEHKDEARAFAGANAAIKKMVFQFFKFGTANTGFTESEWGPFKCGTCTYSDTMADYHICKNDVVGQDSAVPEDQFGNKVIESGDCCNRWTPIEED